jgi:hypothetical protein
MPRYALVIGISEYTGPLAKLSKPETDAEVIAKLLKDYGDFQVKLLNGNVSHECLCQEIMTFGERADGAEALIYFTGHGFPVVGGLGSTKVYLAASDCVIKTNNKQIVGQERGLSLNDINDFIRKSNLCSLIMLLDCCHSGSVVEDSWVTSSLNAMHQKNYYLLAACREFEPAWAIKSEQYSVFTSALVQGLSQTNAASDGKISCDSLFAFVKNLLKGSGQEPISLMIGGNTTIVSYPIKNQILEDELLLCQRNSTTIPEISKGTRIMELKLKAGEVSNPNIDHMRDCVASAETISISWLRKYSSREKAIAQYEHLKMITRTECLEAYNSTKNPNELFGEKMFSSTWNNLRQVHAQEKEKLFGCRFEHLLGFAGILTEECKVWWSEPFDIPEDLQS